MKKISIDILKKGDVVLTTSTTKKSSGIIRAVTKSDISHAMICVSHGSVIDSTGDGVQARNIQKMFYDDSCAIHILRPKDPLPEAVIDEVVNYVRSSTGSRYSFLEAISSISPQLKKKSGRKQFCSRMVARAYAYAGINLVDNPDYCTPEDIKKSELLEFVEPPSVSVSQEEIDKIQKEGDTTEGMRKVTNNLLSKLREFDESIESINDINHLVVQQPELDSKIAQALRESGYLEHWKVETSRFPWRYDPVQIVQFYHSLGDTKLLLDYCHETLNQDENGDFNHWELNAKAYNDIHSHYGYETFQLFADLYLKLSFNHSLRVKSANILSRVYGNPP